MHFELDAKGDTLIVSFVSSKERILLGTFAFVDADGDKRPDLKNLFLALIENNPMFTVIRRFE